MNIMRALLITLALSVPGQAFAIPSPDLVINLSASVAQLLGLLSVVFGGYAIKSRSKAKKRGAAAGRARNSRVLLMVIGALVLGSLATNAIQYTRSIDSRNQRLHTNLVRKSVENGQAVGDVSLKTLSFSEQKSHPQGISTDTLADWLANDKPLNIIDVREDEEFEMGAIDGVTHLRYPDVLANSSLIADDANTLLLCYSGNRSSELCGVLEEQGKSCHFMVGGYEKWLSESRPLATDIDLTSEDLRQLPDYPNKDVLLDTPDVQAMVQNDGAEFIDVRYPDDFVKNHLPGAHNITMRALNSVALADRIAGLDDKPYIAACYDKRSCFYGQLIGLRLSRAGLDFRGRYTVPHEYLVTGTSSDRAHVAAWKAEQQQLTLASYVINPLRSFLDKLVDITGHYGWALLGVVLMVRLLLLPLALKADRDTRVQKSLKERVAHIQLELSDHPRAIQDATFALYKRYRIRPVINMLASLFQLGFMLLFFSAVRQSAFAWPQDLLWLDGASLPDPLLVLPALASVLFLGVMAMQSPPRTRIKASLYVLGACGLFWLLHGLGAAVNLYLGVSMLFLLAQGALFAHLGKRLGWNTLGATHREGLVDDGLVALSDAHHLPEATGKKAARLGELIEAGYNVPNGFVFTSRITNRTRLHPGQPLLDTVRQRKLVSLWSALKADKVAVRSSGANEDGGDNSFAGVYESILNVTREDLLGAVREVYASLGSDRSSAYTRHTATVEDVELDQGGVVVQKMIDAEFAGVMFTEHPGTTGAMMVELVTGLGEDLVSGNVTPDTFAFGKLTGNLFHDDADEPVVPPIDLEPLLALGRELEIMFGAPQDIEWAWAKGIFYLLQSRDITRSVASGNARRNLAELERRKLLGQLLGQRRILRRSEKFEPDQPVFVQNELSELLPRPTPLSADLMERLWAAGGSTDLACEQLGIPYAVHYRSMPYTTTIFGWTYVNRQEERRRLGKGPGALAAFRLARDAEQMETDFREEFLPRFQAEMVERNAIAMDRLSIESAVDMLENWVERFVGHTYVEAEQINVAADFHVKSALEKLEGAGLEPAVYLHDDEETVVSRAMSLLKGSQTGSDDIDEFLLLFGHCAPLDYELSQPRFNEDLNLVRQYVERSNGTGGPQLPGTEPGSEKSAGTVIARTADSTTISPAHDDASPQRASPQHEKPALSDQKVLTICVERARRFMRLKEEAKHYCLIELAQIRSLLLAIDQVCDLGGRIFQLQIDEVLKLGDISRRVGLRELAEQRFINAQTVSSLLLPSQLSITDLERMDMLTGKQPGAADVTDMNGKRVAGEAEVTGRVRVIVDVAEIESFEEGEILVARMTDPTWYPLFAKARGIVTEVGGWLSHAAIVAREFDLPAIVGIKGICSELQTGDVVTLTLDGNVERVEDRRAGTGAMDHGVADAAAAKLAEGTKLVEGTKLAEGTMHAEGTKQVEGAGQTKGIELATDSDAAGDSVDAASAAAAAGARDANGSHRPLLRMVASSSAHTTLDTSSAANATESGSARKRTAAQAQALLQPSLARPRFRYHQREERRALKDKLSERRATPRLTASGELQPDRRVANRAANLAVHYRKTG